MIDEHISIEDLYHLLITCKKLSSRLAPRLQDRGMQVRGGLTPIQRAAMRDLPSLAELAISRGASVNEYCDDGGGSGCTPLHLAAKNDSTRVIRVLVKHGAMVDPLDRYPRTPLALAAFHHRPRALSVLIELGAVIPLACTHPWIQLPTHLSAANGDLKCVRAFVRAGFDFNSRGFDGGTVLHSAAHYDVKMVAYLLRQKRGREIIDTQDFGGFTPLHIAATSDTMAEEKVRLLLRYGANPKLKNAAGRTPADTVSVLRNDWAGEVKDKAGMEKLTEMDFVRDVLLEAGAGAAG